MRADLPNAAGLSRADAIRLAVVLAAALAAFSLSLGNGFVWDDILFVRDNPVLEDLRNIPRFFASGDAVGTYVTNPYYRPLVTASFALDTALWGDAPAGFHATNLLLHLGVCALLFFAVRRLTARPTAAFAAALWFAVHPANAEPVAYVSARADLFCALFALASFHFYLRALERDSRSDRILSHAAFLLALLSKISAGVLPALIAAHLFLVAGTPRRWPRLLPYAAVAIAYLAIRSAVVASGSWGALPLEERLAAAGPFLATYFRNALYPFGLKAFYDLPLRTSFLDGAVVASWAAVASTAAGAALLWLRGRSSAAFGLTWFLVSLLPVSGIVIVLFPAFVADRYLYFPLLGLAIVVGVLADRAAGAIPAGRFRPFASAAAAACVVVLAATASARSGDWGDSLRLWTSSAKGAPGSAYVLNNLGTALRGAGRLEEAEIALRRAIEIDDTTAGPHINLAGVAFARMDLEAAASSVEAALRREPGNPVAINFLGVVHAQRGRFGDAEGCFREALRIWPGYPGAIANLRRLARVAGVGSLRSAALE